MLDDFSATGVQQKVVVRVPTKLVIKRIGNTQNYRMWVRKAGETYLEVKGSKAELACVLGEKGYLPRTFGSKSGFTYIDEIEDPDESGVLERFERYVMPKDVGPPRDFEINPEAPLPEQPKSLYETLDERVGVIAAAKEAAATTKEVVYDVTLQYRVNAYPNEVTESVESIAGKLPDEGVTIISHSADGEKHEGYLQVGTQQNEIGLRDLIFDICRTSRFNPYEIPENISLIVVESSPGAEQAAMMGVETGAQKQTAYMVNLEFIPGTLPDEVEDTAQRIAGSLSNSGLTVGNIDHPSVLSAKLNVTGKIVHDNLKELLNQIRVGPTAYETPNIRVEVMR